MDDVEKGIDGSLVDERSPVSARTSHDLEKAEDTEHADVAEITSDKILSRDTVQSVIVDWSGPNDPEFPQNFPRWRKFLITITSAGTTLVVTFSSSVFSAATTQTAERFHVSEEVMVLGTSLFILGFAVGPSIFGPMSELYGRKIPLFVGFVGFSIFQIPVAVASNLETVLVCRFLQGLFGSSPTGVIGGMLADIWDQRERGFAMPSFAGALFAGPIFGPIVGAYICSSSLGWRWTAWITLIMSGFFGVIAFVCLPETFAPVLLARRAKRLRHQTGNWALHARHEENQINMKDIFNRYIARPITMLCLEPILTLLTLYLAFIYGLVYLFFTAYPISFQGVRGWSAGIASLPFISILIGVLCGCALMAFTTKTRLAPNKEEGRLQETRLILLAVGGAVLPIGLFWFGWTSFPTISPWPQIIAGVPMGFSVILITLQGMNYIIDTYTMYANSAMAGMTFVRSLFGAAFPLFGGYMYNNLGVPWASSVLAFIALAMIPVPLLFYKFGARIRTWSRYVPT